MLNQLLQSPDPIIRCKARVEILGEDPGAPAVQALREEIRACPRVQALLSDREPGGAIPFHPYTKWQGAHWVLTCLADLYYPPGDASLLPLRDQVYAWLFAEEHLEGIRRSTGKNAQVRLHASMEANALFAALRLGLADERAPALAERLLWARWPDGGWNCDRHAKADTSSFFESITPVRALALYARVTGDARAGEAASGAAEIFLERRLYRRKRDGEIMRPEFTRLFYPAYWQYNILFALKVMREAGLLGDPRCADALDLLESKRLPGGGFAAEIKKYRPIAAPGRAVPQGSRANWGPTGANRPNEYITVDALAVLRAAGRV